MNFAGDFTRGLQLLAGIGQNVRLDAQVGGARIGDFLFEGSRRGDGVRGKDAPQSASSHF
jgi:hypothetical protein